MGSINTGVYGPTLSGYGTRIQTHITIIDTERPLSIGNDGHADRAWEKTVTPAWGWSSGGSSYPCS